MTIRITSYNVCYTKLLRIGEIPYEKDVTMAQINGKTLIEYSDSSYNFV